MKNILLKIAICDDSLQDATRLQEILQAINIPHTVQNFSSGEEFLKSFQPNIYDILFIDIFMNTLTGIDVATRVRQLDEKIQLAFTTTSKDHALESYRLRALKYLEKPVEATEVQEMLSLTLATFSLAPKINLLIDSKYEDIFLEDIIYFEQQGHIINLISTQGIFNLSPTIRMTDLITQLPNSFAHIHKSYLINFQHVKSFDKELRVFTMSNNDKTYIRRIDLKNIKESYQNYLFSAVRQPNK